MSHSVTFDACSEVKYVVNGNMILRNITVSYVF